MGPHDVCSLSVLKQQSVHLSRPTCHAICSQSLRQSDARLGQEDVPPPSKRQSQGTPVAASACAPKATDTRREGRWGGTVEDVPVKLHFTVTDKQSQGFSFFLFFFFFLYFPNELAEAANRIHHLTQVAGSWLRDIG